MARTPFRKAAIVATCATVAALGVGACTSSGTTSTPESSPTPTTVATMSADVISETTRMICASEAEHDIATTLGVSTDQPLRPTWIDHVYSCEYQYATGSLRLSVKQLTNRASTDFYFANLASQLGRRQELEGLGQGAFTTTDDSVVVRKDDKVLVVDPRGLPARFGVPPDVRANVAVSVAATIMGCWNGE